MSTIERLEEMMGNGWNIRIECKGKGRGYEMTFEASANKVITDGMTPEEKVNCFYTAGHAVGKSLEELLDNLAPQLTKFESRFG